MSDAVKDGPVAETLRRKLSQALSPERIELEDDSHRHAGHHHHGGVDARPDGESHFTLTVVSAAFEGQSRMMRQRAVISVLREELAGPVHALSIRALTPAEAAAKD